MVLMIDLILMIDVLIWFSETCRHWHVNPLLLRYVIDDDGLLLTQVLKISWHLETTILNYSSHPLHLSLHFLSLGWLGLPEQMTGNVCSSNWLRRLHTLECVFVYWKLVICISERVLSVLRLVQATVCWIKVVMSGSNHVQDCLEPLHVSIFHLQFVYQNLTWFIRIERLKNRDQLCLKLFTWWWASNFDGTAFSYLGHVDYASSYHIHEPHCHDVTLWVWEEELLSK